MPRKNTPTVQPLALHNACVCARSFVWRAAALLVVSLTAACTSTPPQPDRLAREVTALVEPLLAAHQFSGAVVLMRDDRVLFAQGYGQASHAPPLAFTPQTPSDGGSLAKTFTAAGLWWLANEGRLSLDAPVQAFVPEYPHAGVTVAQLLAHSNGLATDYALLDKHFAPGQTRTTPAWLTLAGRETPTPEFAPGSRFEYSNLAYDAAARVIERVSGQSYAEFVRERFFRPHGIVHSFARPAQFAQWPVPRTRGYRFGDGRWQDHDVGDDDAILGASNLIFSALDLARWGSAWAHARVLPAAAERAGSAAPLISGRPSALNGLSWYCAAGGLRCHYTGSYNAFHALVYWDRERRESVAFVSNSTIPPWRIVPLQNGLVQLLAGRPAAAPSPPETALAQTPRQTRSTLAGRFDAPDLGRIEILWDGRSLHVQAPGAVPLRAFAVSRSVFYVPGNDWWIAFSRGAEGEVPPSRLHVRGMYLQTDATRVAD